MSMQQILSRSMSILRPLRWAGMLVLACALALPAFSQRKKQHSATSEHKIRIIHTTDIHGNVFPYDFLNDRPGKGSMARLSTVLQEARKADPNLLLLDAGDLLQGEPPAYYYNYVDTVSQHLIATSMNYLRYDAVAMGNHDIEPGHKVFDKWREECKFPLLGANIISDKTGQPYFKPYQLFQRGGLRIAVLGFTTPAIPQWVPEHLWKGLHFDDILLSASHWIPKIRREEKPDLLVVLMHSGLENDNPDYLENAGRALAEKGLGIDLLLIGHDHRKELEWIRPQGQSDSVLLINPANHLDRVSDIQIRVTKRGDKIVSKELRPSFISLEDVTPDPAFLKHFAQEEAAVKQYLSSEVGELASQVRGEDALFGTTPYMDIIHRMQLEAVGAEISFAAPLKTSAVLPAGKVYIRDLFKFAPFSNFIYAMELTGREIQGYLEHSYAGWANGMSSEGDQLIRLKPGTQPTDKYKTFVPPYNYSAAQGIDYTVDLTKPIGQRVQILRLTGHTEPFDLGRTYRVAVNSYRAGGAGGMLTTGSGIAKEELPKRIVYSTSHDQSYYLAKFFRRHGTVQPVDPKNWRFLPEAWAKEGAERSRAFLFPPRAK